MLTGLTVGQTYDLTFKMASEADFSGEQSLTVSFPTGSSTGSQVLAPLNGPNYWHNWVSQTMDFVATDTSATLQFSVFQAYDVGLDSVSVVASTATPEPGSLVIVAAMERRSPHSRRGGFVVVPRDSMV